MVFWSLSSMANTAIFELNPEHSNEIEPDCFSRSYYDSYLDYLASELMYHTRDCGADFSMARSKLQSSSKNEQSTFLEGFQCYVGIVDKETEQLVSPYSIVSLNSPVFFDGSSRLLNYHHSFWNERGGSLEREMIEKYGERNPNNGSLISVSLKNGTNWNNREITITTKYVFPNIGWFKKYEGVSQSSTETFFVNLSDDTLESSGIDLRITSKATASVKLKCMNLKSNSESELEGSN